MVDKACLQFQTSSLAQAECKKEMEKKIAIILMTCFDCGY